MSGYANNSIFWVETTKIQPNPFQPRREFEPNALEDLADSIRQYGVLQPLVVTRNEEYREDGGMEVSYELIAGERRLRASRLAGLQQVPVIIRKETDQKVKLELAIIENLQREDLNPVERALAFDQLYKEFNLTHAEIGKRMGKSRVYVSNTLRLLALPDDIKLALQQGKITEGHTRPLLMLIDRPEEQSTLFREIIVKNMSVRDAEKIARSVAQDKIRKKEFEVDPTIRIYEKKMSENLGTRVHIEPKEKGGKIVIDYFTIKDLDTILASIKKSESRDANRMIEAYIHSTEGGAPLPLEEEETVFEEEPLPGVNEQERQQEELSRTTPVRFEEPTPSYEPTVQEEPEEGNGPVEYHSQGESYSPYLTGKLAEEEPQYPLYEYPREQRQESYRGNEYPSYQAPEQRYYDNQPQYAPPQRPQQDPYYPPAPRGGYEELPREPEPRKKGFLGRLFG